MKKGAMEFEEIAKFILGIAVLIFAILLAYLLRDKILEVMNNLYD